MDINYWDIAAKHFAGKATPAEEKALRQWLEQNPENREQYEAQQQLWKLTTPAPATAVDTDAAWQKVRTRLQPPHSQQAKVIPLYRQLWRVAAAVVILVGIVWLAKLYFLPYYGLEVVRSGSGQMAVILPDSSQVWLNKESILAYDPDFDGPQREVQLEGEAFFEVTHNPQQPFVIEAEASETQVLGTSFNLRAYPQEQTVELTVNTGKVAFTATEGSAQAIVTPGFGAILQKQKNSVEKYEAAGENTWAWKTGKLHFNGQPLREVVSDLERYYNLKIQLKQPNLGSCRFTGTFQNSDLQEVLQVLEASLQVKIAKQNEQTYTITGEGCH
ncbi:FecR domain-containing protein [uncultured Pontibacter sp.]|uniref:FecR domain-containing protein n=1 Tax=uncultured Pontibacter sp. TaxID=453356 RepID=UPI0026016E41|nr:FecR domain-containing protein [uncultured Pontibacter sp.]